PPTSTLFPTRRSSDLLALIDDFLGLDPLELAQEGHEFRGRAVSDDWRLRRRICLSVTAPVWSIMRERISQVRGVGCAVRDLSNLDRKSTRLNSSHVAI